MADKKFSIGIDFGSNSVRSLIADATNGEEYGSASCTYPGSSNGVYTVPLGDQEKPFAVIRITKDIV